MTREELAFSAFVCFWLVCFFLTIAYTVYDCYRMRDWLSPGDWVGTSICFMLMAPSFLVLCILHACLYTYPTFKPEPIWDEDGTW